MRHIDLPLNITGPCEARSRYILCLDDIPGIGDARRKALMRKFKSLEKIQEASVEELASTETMNMKSASQVYDFFHKKGKNI